MPLRNPIHNVRQIRTRLKLSQEAFWHTVGVSPSIGARYEAGRRMPAVTCELIRLIYIEQIDLAHVNQTQLLICQQLQTRYPDIYTELADTAAIIQKNHDATTR